LAEVLATLLEAIDPSQSSRSSPQGSPPARRTAPSPPPGPPN